MIAAGDHSSEQLRVVLEPAAKGRNPLLEAAAAPRQIAANEAEAQLHDVMPSSRPRSASRPAIVASRPRTSPQPTRTISSAGYSGWLSIEMKTVDPPANAMLAVEAGIKAAWRDYACLGARRQLVEL